MRRTGLSALALACTAVLATTVPAFADDSPSAVPTVLDSTQAPATDPSPVPSKVAEPSLVPSDSRSQVAVVPSGAPDTGEVPTSSNTSQTGLIGGGAAAAVVLASGTVLMIRRRRTNEG